MKLLSHSGVGAPPPADDGLDDNVEVEVMTELPEEHRMLISGDSAKRILLSRSSCIIMR